ncbi:MAG: sodium-dependent transporter [Eggerthellaceae bacterium]|nr:sodium-dependent transporter [Eggerthellaceae bacterium]
MAQKPAKTSGGREHFASRMGFILASVGCAVGLGNVWKFPYITGQYGGAAFVVIYLICLVLLGLPIMVMEFSLGRGSQKSIAGLFEELQPKGAHWNWFKWVAIAGNYLLMMFYAMVAGWLVNYFFKTVTGQLEGITAEQSIAITGEMMSSPFEMVIWLVVVWAIGLTVCSFGVRRGVERASKIFMIGLMILIVVLAIRCCTLPGAEAGLEFYLKPDFGALFSSISSFGEAANAALGHSFFTLSVGIGSMAIFGSYLSRSRRLMGEGISVAALDTLIALSAGLIIFASCFAYGVNPDAGPTLVLQTLPCVFAQMELGRLWGSLFFLLMSFAALSTVVAVYENIICFGMDEWGWSRRKSICINGPLVLVLSIPAALGFNVWADVQFGMFGSIMDLEDFLVSNNILPIGSLIFVLFCTWKNGWGWENFLAEADQGQGPRFPRFMYGWLKFGAPVLIILILVLGWIPKFVS